MNLSKPALQNQPAKVLSADGARISGRNAQQSSEAKTSHRERPTLTSEAVEVGPNGGARIPGRNAHIVFECQDGHYFAAGIEMLCEPWHKYLKEQENREFRRTLAEKVGGPCISMPHA